LAGPYVGTLEQLFVGWIVSRRIVDRNSILKRWPRSAGQITRIPDMAPVPKPIPLAFEPPTHPPKPGIRVFPAPIKGTFVKRLARSRTQAASAEIEESKLEGFLPAHLALNPQKPLMDKRLKRGKFFDPITKLKKGEYMALNVRLLQCPSRFEISPDLSRAQRRLCHDSSSPTYIS
jgi:hypothetical protein